MTDLLRDTLTERADSVEPPPLDIDGIVATGNRQLTRRRAIAVLGGAVATAAVAVGGATVIRPHERRPQPARRPAPFGERRATFALGNEIHYGNEVISVAPHRVNAFVQTDAGFVFLDAKNGIYVADRSGVRSLGNSAWQLTADFRGNLVAWIERFNHFESVVYDVAANRELVRTPIGNKISPNLSLPYPPRIVAIDGDIAYFGTLDGLYRWNVRTNTGELMAKVPPNAVRTVAAGQLVYQQPLVQPSTGLALKVGPTLTSGDPTTYNGQRAFLSPGAKYLVTQPDDAQMVIQPGWASLQLFGVTAERGGPLPRPYWTFLFGQWLDDTHFTAAGVRAGKHTGVVDLLTCSARSGAGTVVAREFSTFTFSTTPPRTAPFALPTGAPIVDLY